MLNYGIESLQIGDINAGTGLPENWANVGDFEKDSAKLETGEPTKTEIFAELKDDAVASITRKGKVTLKFSLMDTAADTVAKYMGGTVTEVAEQPDVWNAPVQAPIIEAAFKATTDTGQIITINRGRVTGQLMGNFSKEGLVTIMVTVDVLTPLVDGVAPMTLTDAG